MQPPIVPIPTHLKPVYQKLRITLWVAMAITGVAVAYTFLFPTISTTFDFRNPKSSRNQIFDPRAETGTPRTNGKLETGGVLIANTSPLGDFSHLTLSIDLEKQSKTPNHIEATIQKGYRAYLFPIGTTITDFPSEALYHIAGTYYALRDGQLHPYISDAAFLSRYPATAAREESLAWRNGFTIASDFLGFRPGSLLSFADGIYIVTSETEIRPIGSAEIFLALGYHFEDVIPVSEEDLGIYKRGRIVLMGAVHPDGTLFEDQDSKTLSLIEGGYRLPVSSGPYHDFLIARTHPILVSESGSRLAARCDATAGLLPRALDCTASLDSLAGVAGSDYTLTLSDHDTDIDIATLTLNFETRLNADNFTALLAKIKQRVLARFGLAAS